MELMLDCCGSCVSVLNGLVFEILFELVGTGTLSRLVMRSGVCDVCG